MNGSRGARRWGGGCPDPLLEHSSLLNLDTKITENKPPPVPKRKKKIIHRLAHPSLILQKIHGSAHGLRSSNMNTRHFIHLNNVENDYICLHLQT